MVIEQILYSTCIIQILSRNTDLKTTLDGKSIVHFPFLKDPHTSITIKAYKQYHNWTCTVICYSQKTLDAMRRTRNIWKNCCNNTQVFRFSLAVEWASQQRFVILRQHVPCLLSHESLSQVSLKQLSNPRLLRF